MIKIDSVNHLKTLMSAEYFSIEAIFGPKTECKVERFSKTSKILHILSKSQVFDGTFDDDPLYNFDRIYQAAMNTCGASNIHFGLVL